jgi:hypothetical protein
MKTILASLYFAAVLALVAAAVGNTQLRCEGFGCMGIGVAWFAWAFAYCLVLGLGVFIRSQAEASLTKIVRAGWWLQLATALGVLVLWISKRLG